MALRLIVLLALLSSCSDRAEKFPEPGVVIENWVPTSVGECGFEVELPMAARRDESILGDGTRSILYMVDASPEKYVIACLLPPESAPVPTPAQALRGQAENLKLVLSQSGLVLSDMKLREQPDGGEYELVYSTGIRVKGQVHLVGPQIHDLSGSFDPQSPRSVSQLERVFASYRRSSE